MSLKELGFDEHTATDGGVAILVGPNGAGKSFYMLSLAESYRTKRNITVISNTAYGRLNSVRNVNRLTVGRNGPSPSKVIKNAISKTLDSETSEFYQLSAILDYCHYYPRFGFSLKGCNPSWPERFENLVGDPKRFLKSAQEMKDYQIARNFIERWTPGKILWIDQSSTAHEYSLSRDFAALLRCEKLLKKFGLLDEVEVHLSKKDGGMFEISGASSGELSLISSLIFISSTVPNNSVILIDEPENSLHPSWQREYVGKIFAALGYRNVSVIIATHSPLLVTGAVNERPDLVTVYEVSTKDNGPIEIDRIDVESSGIEAILWKVFEVVTPESHFVSEEIIDSINQYEHDEITKNQVTSLIQKMRKRSFDDNQTKFFSALIELVDKVEKRKINQTGQKSGI